MKFDFTETMTFDKMNDTVNSLLPKRQCPLIQFSIFKDAGNNDNDEWLVSLPNILSDKPILEGTYNFLIDYWRVSSVAKMSAPVQNPTWKDIIIQFNELLQDRGINLFLEGMKVNPEDNTVEFFVGS